MLSVTFSRAIFWPAETGADAQPAAPTKPKGPVEVTMVLESKMIAGGLVRFKEGRTPANTSLVVVDDVYDEGEAYRRGLRRGMVLKAMTGTNGDERTEMWELDDKGAWRGASSRALFRLPPQSPRPPVSASRPR